MVHHPKDIQPTKVGIIGVNMGQHPCRMLSTPCRVHAPTNLVCSEGKMGVQLNIWKVLFCTLSVYVCLSLREGRTTLLLWCENKEDDLVLLFESTSTAAFTPFIQRGPALWVT